MTTAIRYDPLRIRKALGREEWLPPEPYGPDGWWFDTREPDAYKRILVSRACWDEDMGWTDAVGVQWIHASFSYPTQPDTMPTYDDLKLMHRAVFGDSYAYQVFAPQAQHVNITANVLHLWGREDGQPCLPEFGRYGSI